MATCSIFANPVIDTEEGAIALADAYDRFLEEQAKRPPREPDVSRQDEFPELKEFFSSRNTVRATS